MRKICVVTGGRADYGLLYWLLKEIDADPELELQIVATGMHLSPEFGLTYQTILDDGFQINARVEMLLSSDTPVGITKSVGVGLIGFADAYAQLTPDVVVILGDRFEMLAAAQAAYLADIPLAHISGGEVTEGVIDDAIRHCITKLSHYHFTATADYRRRVIQLGEAPERVFNVGEIGLDNLKKLQFFSRAELAKELQFDLTDAFILVTYHPETLNTAAVENNCRALLAALDQQDCRIIFTKTNADTAGRIINKMIADYVAAHEDRAILRDALGSRRYLSAVKEALAVVGNSSSGIVEAPSLGTPTINIGIRQQGRTMAPTILSVAGDTAAITQAFAQLQQPAFKADIANAINPYAGEHSSGDVKEILKSCPTKPAHKVFYDLPTSNGPADG